MTARSSSMTCWLFSSIDEFCPACAEHAEFELSDASLHPAQHIRAPSSFALERRLRGIESDHVVDCVWPGPGSRWGFRKPTSVDNVIASEVSFLTLLRTHAAGQKPPAGKWSYSEPEKMRVSPAKLRS